MRRLPFAVCLLAGSLAASLAGSLASAQSAAPRDRAAASQARGFTLPERRELVGKPITQFPYFQFTRTLNEGDAVRIAFDTRTDSGLALHAVDVYLIEHERFAQALAGERLTSLALRSLRVKLGANGVRENNFVLDAGTLSGAGKSDAQGTVQLGRGYDVLVDRNGNGALESGDLVDGDLDRAGFYVVQDFVTFKAAGSEETGPYAVTEVLFSGGTFFTQEDIYFPSNIAELGELPLISVSHGNGHDYRWYDHIGYHMASFGYVVMSHANNTGPGIETAAVSTLTNNELFLKSLGTIAGGALAGHVDSHRIVWMGHSRGGEGVVRAYKLLSAGSPLATRYTLADIRLVSSIAPTDFEGPVFSDMGTTPYHLWTGGADADVSGCASCDICQTFHLLERADGPRFSISLHGAGHGDFHDDRTSSEVANGPCKIRRTRTHAVMRGYLLPLVQFVLDGNPACQDYLTRQYEEFRALGAPDPENPDDRCVVVDMMYLPGPGNGRVMIDDFQSHPETTRSSSGGAVQSSPGLAATFVEGRFDDGDRTFTDTPLDPMNGMTFAGPGDTSAGAVLEWNAAGGSADEWLLFEVPAIDADLSTFSTLSFRAAQVTRASVTDAEAGDLDFSVELIDGARRGSSIRISAYGGGIEEPYQRGSCGLAKGWGNEFETIRIPLADFRRDGKPLDLAHVAAIRFLFGPASGSTAGRIGLDEIEFVKD